MKNLINRAFTAKKKTFLIVTAALLSLSMNAASWTFTSIRQSDFYPAGQDAVNGDYWAVEGSASYKYKNQSTADELYVADGQKFAPTEGLKFLTRGSNFRVFFNGSGILLTNPNVTGVNPSIVIPNCKAGSDLRIVAKQNASGTMALTNANDASFTLDGSNTTYVTNVLTDGDVVINMSAGAGYVRSIEVTPKSVYAATTTKAVVTLFENDVTGVETTCTTRRDAKNYTIDGQAYNSVQAWTMGTTTNLTFRVKNAKKVTFVGRAPKDRGFAISLNGAAAENVTNTTGSEANVEKELTMVDDMVNIISITGVGGAVYPLAFIVEKDLEPIAPAMSGESLSFENKDKIIYSGNIALSTVTNLEGADKQGFSTASNIVLYTSGSEAGKTKALRVQGTSTITIAAPSNYVIEKIGIRAATGASTGERTITVNGANGKKYGPVVENTESPYYEWELATPSNHLEVSTNGTMFLIITLFGYVNEFYPVTISNNWASFCAPQDVELPSGVYAYVADIVRDEEGDEDVLYINKVENSAIPANTGVFLYSETDGDYQLPYTLGAPAIAKNLFTGTVARTANPSTDTETGTTYSLYDDNGTVCLVRYTGAYIPANKAYLNYSGGGRAAAPRMRVHVGPYNTPTAIDEVQTSTAQTNKRIENGQLIIIRDGVKYNIQGQIVK